MIVSYFSIIMMMMVMSKRPAFHRVLESVPKKNIANSGQPNTTARRTSYASIKAFAHRITIVLSV